VEDYAKALYALEARGDGPVGTSALADRLGLTPGSVSAMLRKLNELGLLTLAPYRGVHLTEEGRRLALEVMRHHRLIELFLAQQLGMAWDRVHQEAEVLEHWLSEDPRRRSPRSSITRPSIPTAIRSPLPICRSPSAPR